MSILLVTGTSTDVGKTVVTAALASLALQSGKSVAVLKPAQTGVDVDGAGDLAEIERLTGGGATLVELARYPEPLAPDTAARRSGLPLLALDDVVRVASDLDTTHDLTLIEGAAWLAGPLGRRRVHRSRSCRGSGSASGAGGCVRPGHAQPHRTDRGSPTCIRRGMRRVGDRFVAAGTGPRREMQSRGSGLGQRCSPSRGNACRKWRRECPRVCSHRFDHAR